MQSFQSLNLDAWQMETWQELAVEGIPVAEVKDLARMFRSFGDAGYHLVAWF